MTIRKGFRFIYSSLALALAIIKQLPTKKKWQNKPKLSVRIIQPAYLEFKNCQNYQMFRTFDRTLRMSKMPSLISFAVGVKTNLHFLTGSSKSSKSEEKKSKLSKLNSPSNNR